MTSYGICLSLSDSLHLVWQSYSRSIHVAVNGIISFSFLWLSGIIPLCVCVYHIFFIQSSVDGHSGCFHVPKTMLNFTQTLCSWKTGKVKELPHPLPPGKLQTAKNLPSPPELDKTHRCSLWEPRTRPDTDPPDSHPLSHKWCPEWFVPTDELERNACEPNVGSASPFAPQDVELWPPPPQSEPAASHPSTGCS